MARRYPNGVSFTEKVKRTDLPFRFSRSDNVIGLDFGTSTVAASYVTSTEPSPQKIKIHQQDTVYYSPTVLLIAKSREKKFNVDIGIKALRQYTELEVDVTTTEVIFFEKVKLELQHNKNVNRKTTIKSSDGREYYLIEVIAIILKKIKEYIVQFFENAPGGYMIKDFDWAITVPALWGMRARDMMREAAYLAGLCTDLPIWSHHLPIPLQPASTHEPVKVKSLEPNPDKLSLVFEPEAAAVACMDLRCEASDSSTSVRPSPNDCYLTVDIGGGTIDITAHQVCEDGTLRILDIPHGRIYGGTEVNKKFEEFIGNVVGNPTFSRYLGSNAKHKDKERSALLFSFINKEFERVKKDFGSENRFAQPTQSPYLNVRMPSSFVEVYEHQLQAIANKRIKGDTHVSFRRSTQQLSISTTMFKEFFELNVTKTKECIDEALEIVGRDKVKIIYLVGSFGGCKYMTSSVEYHYPDIRVIRPSEPEYAVSQGACLFYKKKVLRTADATYGIHVGIKYDHSNPVHKSVFKISTDAGEQCSNLFNPYIHTGDPIDSDFVYSGTFFPFMEAQKSLSFEIYSTLARYIHYVRNEDGSLPDGLEELGDISVDISNGMHLTLDKRAVQFVLDFSSTEIHISGWFKEDNTLVKTTCDFLSTIENVKKFAK